jgi:hypothetical protein
MHDDITTFGFGGVNRQKKYKERNVMYTEKKENQIFLMDKEIQTGSGAKSYMTNGLLTYD